MWTVLLSIYISTYTRRPSGREALWNILLGAILFYLEVDFIILFLRRLTGEVNHVDSDCLKYRMQTLILCIFGRGVETHHACSFIFSWCRPSKWALIGRQPTEVPALREAGENLISPAPVAPDYQALSVPARPSVNVLICVFTPNLSIGVSEASRQLRARCLCAMRSIYETGSPFSLQMRGSIYGKSPCWTVTHFNSYLLLHIGLTSSCHAGQCLLAAQDLISPWIISF